LSQTERIFTIHRLLGARRAPTLEALMNSLEVSKATIKRDIEYMRSRLHAPISYDPTAGGYRYRATPDHPPYELPGLWFSAEEMHALLVMQDLLAQMQSGLLGEPLRPLQRKIETLIEKGTLRKRELARRFRILGARQRPVESRHFQAVSTATLQRRRLKILYFSRSRNETLAREVSPQRLIWYNSNWYLDAFCHLRNEPRSFSLDSIREARILAQPAQELDLGELEERLGSGYGIFAGKPTHTAVLRFRPPAALWVARESWHPRQKLTPQPGGEVLLEVPYADSREMVMDILRYGADVVVEAPGSLREAVSSALRAAAERYAPPRRAPARIREAGA
jgi:predicted DNA-binding transcriptional regulator YafY